MIQKWMYFWARIPLGPFDKAGGYAIQGRAAVFVENLRGSYYGVMGLPLRETFRLLKNANVYPTWHRSRVKK